MLRCIGIISVLAALLFPRTALAALPVSASVKDVALAFGNAIAHNDGGKAVSLLSPDLRRRIQANQLPSLLNVTAPPTAVHVVRWYFNLNQDRGDATLSLRYPRTVVAERLNMRHYREGWRIISIVPEDPLALQRGAETAVVAFCDAAVRMDLTGMRTQLTARFAAKVAGARVLKLLGLTGPLVSYSVLTYAGGPAGATMSIRLLSDSEVVRDRFSVINDRDGWRIAAIARGT